jgi:CarD family transcriptional regulator
MELSSKRMPVASAMVISSESPLYRVTGLRVDGEMRPVRASCGKISAEGEFMAAKALSFDVGDYVVYPKHGVGRVIELQSTDIAGMQLELYVLRFEKERMTLRVPTNKAESVGMRKLSSDKTLRDALETLKGKPKVKRTMWSRRAQEYEAKINSGDLISIAEVTRDLFRADDQPEQSYSERQIFEAASSRLARELAAMEQVDEPAALVKILEILNKAAAIYNKDKVAA